MVALFAFAFVPGVAASTQYQGTLTCVSPTSCSSGTLHANGPGSTVHATYTLTSNAPNDTLVNFYICEQNVTSGCSVSSGSANGWSWSFTPSGTTNATGAITGLDLSITAPSSSSGVVYLEIYACSQGGTNQFCAGNYLQVASATITSTVPQFGLGLSLAIIFGMLGLIVIRKRSISLPTPYAAI